MLGIKYHRDIIYVLFCYLLFDFLFEVLFFCYSQTYNTLEKKLDDQKEDIQELTEQLEEVKEKLERRQETQKAATADNPSRRERKWCDDEHVRCPTESHRVAQSPTEPHKAP